ncbi:hypothetical protein B0H13DRAFT_1915778 [Mycena leptocephala]|nr:hypothetical protein B0H13DRAFT_1915778 [Mycena leptocephala]
MTQTLAKHKYPNSPASDATTYTRKGQAHNKRCTSTSHPGRKRQATKDKGQEPRERRPQGQTAHKFPTRARKRSNTRRRKTWEGKKKGSKTKESKLKSLRNGVGDGGDAHTQTPCAQRPKINGDTTSARGLQDSNEGGQWRAPRSSAAGTAAASAATSARIHRLWVVSGFRPRIIMFPSVTLMGLLAFGVGLTCQMSAYTSNDSVPGNITTVDNRTLHLLLVYSYLYYGIICGVLVGRPSHPRTWGQIPKLLLLVHHACALPSRRVTNKTQFWLSLAAVSDKSCPLGFLKWIPDLIARSAAPNHRPFDCVNTITQEAIAEVYKVCMR